MILLKHGPQILVSIVVLFASLSVNAQETHFLQPGHTRDLLFAGWSPDGNLLASYSGADGWLKIWNPKNGKLVWDIKATSLTADQRLTSPDGKLAVSRTANDSFEVRDALSGNLIWTIRARATSGQQVTSPDGAQFAERGLYGDAVVKVFDAKTNQLIRRLEGHPGIIYALAFSPDGRIIASGSGDHTIKFWRSESGALVKSLFGHTDRVTSVAFSRDGELLVSGSKDDTLKIWNAGDGRLLRTMSASSFFGGIRAVAISPDRRFIIAGSGTRVQVWNTETGKKISTLETRESHTAPGAHGVTITWCCGSEVHSVAYSPDGSLIVSAHEDGTIKIWDPEKVEPTRIIKGRSSDSRSVAFSPDGKSIAAGYHQSDTRVDLWSVETGELIASLDEGSDYIQSVSFTSDGKLIVTGDISGDVNLWDVKTGKLIREFKQPYSQNDRVVFSPDGKYIVSGGENQNVMFWDVQTGKLIWSALPIVP